MSTSSLRDDDDTRCEFYSGAPGRDVSIYKSLKLLGAPARGISKTLSILSIVPFALLESLKHLQNSMRLRQNSPIQNGAPDSDVSSKDVEELLRIIRKPDYKVVEQLGQTQSKISVLQLLMCSEGHRDALLVILNGAYVPHEIYVNQLEAVANNISAGNGLGIYRL